jgi:putative Mg2+ transporter-C (MgtC) family protein
MQGAELLDVSVTCLGRLAVAAVCGAIVGWEREFHEKGAGLRTHMLITVGACLFALVGVQIRKDFPDADPMRLIQGLVIGVGFISGGVIFTRGGSVKGLTTATGLWLVTGVGMAAGLGYTVLAVLGTLLGFVIIAALKQTDAWLHRTADRGRSDTPEIS